MTRKPFPKPVEAAVFLASRRRCALCFGLHGDFRVKLGQLAHIDRNPSNSAEENAAFLCTTHHAKYDTVSRQTKGFSPDELKLYRTLLYEHVQKPGARPDTVALKEGATLQRGKHHGHGVSLDVYDRRVPVYRKTTDFMRTVLKDLNPQIEDIFRFATDTDEALFLFADPLPITLHKSTNEALRLHALAFMLYPRNATPGTVAAEAEANRPALAAESTEIAVWFSAQFEELRTRLVPFLQLAD
jgi:hypothetical protein